MILKIVSASTQGLTYSVVHEGNQGEVIDLSHATAKIMVKRSVYDPDNKAIIVKEIVHPDSNLLYFQIDAEDTMSLPSGKYYVSLKLFYDSGVKLVLREDTLLISKGVFDA